MLRRPFSPVLLAEGSFLSGGCIAEGEIDGDNCFSECNLSDVVDLLPADPFGMVAGIKPREIEGCFDGLEFDEGRCDGIQMSIQCAALDGFWEEVRGQVEFPGDISFGFKCNAVDEGCYSGFAYIDGFGSFSVNNSGSEISSDFDGGSAYASSSSDFGSHDLFWVRPEVKGRTDVSYPIWFGLDDCIRSTFQELKAEYFSYSDGPRLSCANNDLCIDLGTNGDAGLRMTGCPEHYDEGFPGGGGGSPHLALSLAFGYLGVRDLLLVERVCTSFRSTIKGDPLLWQNICIDKPLNEKLTDDILLDLTSRSQGSLQCLSLVECPNISNECLRVVFESNPKLSKLSVSGSTRISIDGIIKSLRACKSTSNLQLKCLRVGGLYGLSRAHFEELKILLGIKSQSQKNLCRPHHYRGGNVYLPLEDDRALDMELCPRCQNPRLVYDCPLEFPEGAEVGPAPECRACILCVVRCMKCGRCINEDDYEETFFLEFLCSGCSNEPILRSQEAPGEEGSKVRHYSFSC